MSRFRFERRWGPWRWLRYRVTGRRRPGLAVLASGLFVLGVVGQASAAACKNPAGQPPPPRGAYESVFNGVAATSGCKASAVGYYTTRAGGELTLIERWNGKAWIIQPSPDPGGSAESSFNELSGVAATSPTNAWAVGSYFNGTGDQTLIEHWNGTAWTVQPSPNPAGSNYDNVLYGVVATSPTNVWAVGVHYYENGEDTITAGTTLIEHWNGKVWTIQASPNRQGPSYLSGVAATSSKNAWAVGYYYTDPLTGATKTLIEHWNGKAWTIQPSPNPARSMYDNHNSLSGVAATSFKNAWAVGYVASVGAVIEHWNGRAWKVQRSPRSYALYGVAATSSQNAWAVGAASAHPHFMLIEHWGGKAWKVQPHPTFPGKNHPLYGVAATSRSNAWVVGYGGSGAPDHGPLGQTFALHWDGRAWKG